MTTLVAPTPEAGSKAAQILDAAGRLFLESGFGAVSMDMIAKTANVSKATLYAHFGSKEELFRAIVAGECRSHMCVLSREEIARMEVDEVLRQLGRRFIALVTSPKAIAGYRVVMGEAHRFPELARAFYETGPAVSIRQLADLLADADARGLLAIPDPLLAAEQFLGMLKAHLHLRLIIGMQERPTDAELDRIVEGAVTLICRGYAPR